MGIEIQSNAVRGPVNAWILRLLEGYMDRIFGASKRMLFESHPDTIVEIGPGSGANMRYFKKGTRLIAIEPNVHMHANLKKSAITHGIDLEIRSINGESIDLPDNSCDFVIGTLVLCTVQNPEQCINQIKRVLKPYGVFTFIEHVKAKENSFLSLMQNLSFTPWHWFFEGCHTNRDTKYLIESSGFGALELETYNLYSPFIPIIPQIRGWAIK